jgi:hypothetical protein
MEVINKETGKVEMRDIETGPPNPRYRNGRRYRKGWRKDFIKPGEQIMVLERERRMH